MVHLAHLAVSAALVSSTLAFPTIPIDFEAAAVPKVKRVNGVAPGFNAAAQKISTTGDHKYVAPQSGDQRGPCPGLNALANHNYLPHNGVATIQQFIDATNSVFGMGIDLATFLAVYGAVQDGDLKSWSIGGPPGGSLLPGILSAPQGISYSHNKYESDVSPTRGDQYTAGNAYKLQLNQFQQLYNYQSGVSNDQANYDLNILTDFRAKRFADSKTNNPYFYNGAFTGVAVQPAAYTFIYRFMANKSAEHPEGVLNKDVLKSFFAISGDDNNLKWNEGQERIPDNWYKRAVGDEYTIPFFQTDLLAAALQHPEFLSVGGNTGKGDSFAGVDITNLTGGLYNAKSLTQGNNLGCFAFQSAIQFAPDFLQGLVSDVTGAVQQISNSLGGALNSLGCPQLSGKWDNSQLKQFPGYTKLKSNGGY